jgi:hypothetical protein
MTPSPHARHASVRERTDAQKGPVMKWIGGSVALRRRLDHSEATPATVGSPSTVCDKPLQCSDASKRVLVLTFVSRERAPTMPNHVRVSRRICPTQYLYERCVAPLSALWCLATFGLFAHAMPEPGIAASNTARREPLPEGR